MAGRAGVAGTAGRCRGCGGPLDTVLDLGMLQISDFPAPVGPHARMAPLDCCQCRSCSLVQLRHTVDPDALFREYWYRSGVNEVMRAELRSIVEQANTIAPVGDRDIVLDVGANDGTLLRAYDAIGRAPIRIAVEPADNLRPLLVDAAAVVSRNYFPDPALTDAYRGRVRHLTSIACFYDADDPHAFVEAVEELLASDGIWIVQFQDLAQMLDATAFDNLCHEHLVYYSLGSFERLIGQHGLRVVEAERRAINGGSLRLTVMRHSAGPRGESVAALREAEKGCEHWHTLEQFAGRVWQVRAQISAIISTAFARGQIVDLYGASTKANTLLQACRLGPTAVRQAWERSEAKWGRTTVTGIPIVSEADGRADPPHLLLCGIWQFRDAVIAREAEYLRRGGTLIFPLPELDLVQVATC